MIFYVVDGMRQRMGFDEAFEMADEALLLEMGRSPEGADAVKIDEWPVRAIVGVVSSDSQPADGGGIPGATVRVTISVDDFTQLGVRVGTHIVVPGAVRENVIVLGIHGSGRLRALICGATGTGRQSEF